MLLPPPLTLASLSSTPLPSHPHTFTSTLQRQQAYRTSKGGDEYELITLYQNNVQYKIDRASRSCTYHPIPDHSKFHPFAVPPQAHFHAKVRWIISPLFLPSFRFVSFRFLSFPFVSFPFLSFPFHLCENHSSRVWSNLADPKRIPVASTVNLPLSKHMESASRIMLTWASRVTSSDIYKGHRWRVPRGLCYERVWRRRCNSRRQHHDMATRHRGQLHAAKDHHVCAWPKDWHGRLGQELHRWPVQRCTWDRWPFRLRPTSVRLRPKQAAAGGLKHSQRPILQLLFFLATDSFWNFLVWGEAIKICPA